MPRNPPAAHRGRRGANPARAPTSEPAALLAARGGSLCIGRGVVVVDPAGVRGRAGDHPADRARLVVGRTPTTPVGRVR